MLAGFDVLSLSTLDRSSQLVSWSVCQSLDRSVGYWLIIDWFVGRLIGQVGGLVGG